jgi:hypothetical protein
MRKRMRVVLLLAVVLSVGLAGPASAAWVFERLSDNSGSSYFSSVAVSGSNLHVFWQDDTYGNYEIFYKRSINNGSSWTFERFTNNSGESGYPAAAVDGSNIHVVWEDDSLYGSNIFYKRSTDGGASWVFQHLVPNTLYAYSPEVAVSGSNVWVVWVNNASYGNNEICSKRSTDNGSSWTFQRLSSNSGSSLDPGVAVSGSNVCVVWYDDSYGGNKEIFSKRSTNGGGAWTFQRLTDNSGDSRSPGVAADGNNLHVVWDDTTYTTNHGEIFYKRSTDNGSSWSFQRLTNNSGSSLCPAVSALGGNVRVVWEDLTYGNREIFYKGSTNNGSSWAFQRLTSNLGSSARPDVAEGDNVSVVWQDDTYGNNEIFYKRGP